MTLAGALYELPTPALPTAEPASSSLLLTPVTEPQTGNGHARNLGKEVASLPTPRASRGASGTETMYALGGERTDQGRPQGEVLLPTPVADHSRGLPQPGTDYQSLPNVALSLLPTPQAHDAQGAKTPQQVATMRAKGHGVRNLNETAEHELSGQPTSPPSAAGKPSSDDPPPDLLSLDEPESA